MNSPFTYDKIKDSLSQFLPDKCKTRLDNYALLIYGIFESQSVNLGRIASCLPLDAKKLSIVRRFERFFNNAGVDPVAVYKPWIESHLATASKTGHVRLVLDTTKVTTHAKVLILGVTYESRVIPLIWDNLHTFGHFPSDVLVTILKRIYEFVPQGVTVSLVGDGEFSRPEMVNLLNEWQWNYALRVAGRFLFGETTQQKINSHGVTMGNTIWIGEGIYTESHQVNTKLLIHWKKGEKDPWYLLTNQENSEKTIEMYQYRAWIEQTFADLKGRGFNLENSRFETCERINRLILLMSILYNLLLAIGEYVIENKLTGEVDRNDRRDLSIFRMGVDWVRRRMALHKSIPILLIPNICSGVG